MVILVLTVGKLGLSGFPWAWQLLAAAFGFLNLSSRETLLCKGGGSQTNVSKEPLERWVSLIWNNSGFLRN